MYLSVGEVSHHTRYDHIVAAIFQTIFSNAFSHFHLWYIFTYSGKVMACVIAQLWAHLILSFHVKAANMLAKFGVCFFFNVTLPTHHNYVNLKEQFEIDEMVILLDHYGLKLQQSTSVRATQIVLTAGQWTNKSSRWLQWCCISSKSTVKHLL